MSKIHKEISVLDRLPDKDGEIVVRHVDLGLTITYYVKSVGIGNAISHWLEEQKPEEEVEEPNIPIRQIVLDTVSDLVSCFIYEDRKEDENLSEQHLEDIIKNGTVSIDEIVQHFRNELEKAYEDN